MAAGVAAGVASVAASVAARRPPTGLYSAAIGWSAQRSVPRPLRAPLYRAFARAVGANLDEPGQPLAEYPSLGAFFARRLRPEARSFTADPSAVLSPSDGVVAAVGVADRGSLIQAKGKDYDLAALVVDRGLADALTGGPYTTIYLSPRDYHRVHAPVSGVLRGYDYVPGVLWPVSPWFSRNIDDLLVVNERVVIRIDTPAGPVAVVMVGAAGVGNLWLEHLGTDSLAWRAANEPRRIDLPRPVEVAAGDELGAFHLGSTVVLVLPRGHRLEGVEVDGAVRCGQVLGSAPASTTTGRGAADEVRPGRRRDGEVR